LGDLIPLGAKSGASPARAAPEEHWSRFVLSMSLAKELYTSAGRISTSAGKGTSSQLFERLMQ
jgi:hypothetical protein